VTALRTTPVITWAAPSPITAGTPLGALQLSASASVPGAFAYSPAAGTVLAAGTQTLRTTFTPADTTLYTPATASTSLTVNSVLPLGGPYTLTVVRPSGGVLKSAGIDCGTNSEACAVTMPGPMTISLQATADPGYVFLAWTVNCSGRSSSYALALEGPRTCGAVFTPAGGARAYFARHPGGDETFIGPRNGGGWRGTILDGQLVYRRVSYPIKSGTVTLPDCRRYVVALGGALFGGTPGPCPGSGPDPTTSTITSPTPAPITPGPALSGTQLDPGAGVPGTSASLRTHATITPDKSA